MRNIKKYKNKIIKIRKKVSGRYTKQYQNWRKQVLNRDNHKCQICGRTNIRLQVHHIKSFKKFIHLRHDINNGITLCSGCHYKFHKKYGKQSFPDITKLYKLKLSVIKYEDIPITNSTDQLQDLKDLLKNI